jgi:pilus assembly protein CpaE
MRGRLRAVIICPDSDLASQLATGLSQLEQLVSVKATVPGYPSPVELSRVLRAHMPDVVLLSFERPELAIAVIASIEAEARGLPVVGVNRTSDARAMLDGMHAGLRDFLNMPFEAETLATSLHRLKSMVEREPPAFGATEHIYSFLPAKPGVGATTLALNTCAALGRENGSALLVDLDLSCGMIRFLLRVAGEYSIVDAARRAGELDEALWPQLVAQRHGLDVLDSGPMNPHASLKPEDLQVILNFARRRYGAICLDLSGNMEQYAVAAMEDSRQIFLVCTPEPASLQLAKEKLAFLKSRRLDSRVAVLLNRLNQHHAYPALHFEELLEVPVLRSFDNDYASVQRSVQDAVPLPSGTPLGRQFNGFARLLLGRPGDAPPVKRRFLGLFAPAMPSLAK